MVDASVRSDGLDLKPHRLDKFDPIFCFAEMPVIGHLASASDPVCQSIEEVEHAAAHFAFEDGFQDYDLSRSNPRGLFENLYVILTVVQREDDYGGIEPSIPKGQHAPVE